MSTVSIRAHAIARRFGDEQAVAGVDLEIRAGRLLRWSVSTGPASRL
jgi:ABC-type uncharacterized transport system ATPase subunit